MTEWITVGVIALLGGLWRRERWLRKKYEEVILQAIHEQPDIAKGQALARRTLVLSGDVRPETVEELRDRDETWL